MARHRRKRGVVLRVLGYDPSWFSRTLGVLLVVAAGETAWGAELALRGRLLMLAWLIAFVLAWLGFLLVIEPGSRQGSSSRLTHRRSHDRQR